MRNFGDGFVGDKQFFQTITLSEQAESWRDATKPEMLFREQKVSDRFRHNVEEVY